MASIEVIRSTVLRGCIQAPVEERILLQMKRAGMLWMKGRISTGGRPQQGVVSVEPPLLTA